MDQYTGHHVTQNHPQLCRPTSIQATTEPRTAPRLCRPTQKKLFAILSEYTHRCTHLIDEHKCLPYIYEAACKIMQRFIYILYQYCKFKSWTDKTVEMLLFEY